MQDELAEEDEAEEARTSERLEPVTQHAPYRVEPSTEQGLLGRDGWDWAGGGRVGGGGSGRMRE